MAPINKSMKILPKSLTSEKPNFGILTKSNKEVEIKAVKMPSLKAYFLNDFVWITPSTIMKQNNGMAILPRMRKISIHVPDR